MGIYDRDYSRGNQLGMQLSAPRSATAQIVLVAIAAYIAQLSIQGFTNLFELHANWYLHPWQFYQLLTYGFLHAPNDAQHIVINMLVLWMFGRDVEQRLGRGEFLAFYLTAIVIAGAFWTLSEVSFGSWHSVLGASGGISALFVLYALLYPHRQILFMFVIPMPVWVAALLGIAWDVKGALVRSGNIACVAHLAGAVFGLYYYKFNWRLAPLFTRWLPSPRSFTAPRLRVHQPPTAEPPGNDDYDDDLNQQLDDVLKKVYDHGQESLTPAEKKLLERASRRAQQKRR